MRTTHMNKMINRKIFRFYFFWWERISFNLCLHHVSVCYVQWPQTSHKVNIRHKLNRIQSNFRLCWIDMKFCYQQITISIGGWCETAENDFRQRFEHWTHGQHAIAIDRYVQTKLIVFQTMNSVLDTVIFGSSFTYWSNVSSCVVSQIFFIALNTHKIESSNIANISP